MNKIFLFIVLLGSLVYGIEIDIKPDKKIVVSSEDISSMKRFLKERYRFVPNSNKDVSRIIRENRILANEYVKKNLDAQKIKDLQIELENRFAMQYIQFIQRKIKIPMDVIKSYYYDHIDEFKKSDQIHLIRLRFKKFDDAMRFYQNIESAKRGDTAVSSIKSTGYTKTDKGYIDFDRIREPLKSLLVQGKSNYYTPPLIWKKGIVDIFYVKDYKVSKGHVPFEKVKDSIKNILYQRTLKRKRKEILSKYKSQG